MRKRAVALSAAVVGMASVGGLELIGALAAPAAASAPCCELPAPKVKLSRTLGGPFEGEFILRRVPWAAGVLAASLDIRESQESQAHYYLGELTLRFRAGRGTSETEFLELWSFEFHKASNQITALLIPTASVDAKHIHGQTVGQMAFVVPAGMTDRVSHGEKLSRLSDVVMTLNGHPSCPLTFARTSAIGFGIPSAELSHGRCAEP